MNEIKINNTHFSTPESYNELSPTQLLGVCKHILTHKGLTPYAILMELMGIKRGLIFQSAKLRFIKSLPSAYLTWCANDAQIVGWIYKPAKLSNYTISKFKFHSNTYHGPHESMLNITVAEFIEVSTYYGAYLDSLKNENANPELLVKLIAVLFRPVRAFYAFEKHKANFNIDCRQKNNEFRFTKRCKLFAKLKPELKMAIFLQYEGALEEFATNFPNAFSGSSSGQADPKGWIKLLMSMSNDIFGDYEKTQNIDLFTFFTKVDTNIHEAKELEKKYKTKK